MALNQVTLMGRLVSDPVTRSAGESTVASFCIAVDRDYKNKDGEREADFINVTAWRSTADTVAKYFTKGSPIVVVGRLQTRSYDDKDGNKRTVTEVVASNVYFSGGKSDSKNGNGGGDRGRSSGSNSGGNRSGNNRRNTRDIDDDGDYPF